MKMNRSRRHAWWLAAFLALSAAPAAAQMCKWVDEDGVVHYATVCPEGVETDQVEILEAPASTAPSPGQPARYAGLDPDRNARNLSWQALGQFPEMTQSRYLATTSALVRPDPASLGAQFIIRVTATKRLQPGNVLEARFPDPSAPGRATFEQVTYEGLAPIIRIASRPRRGFLCWNYHVVVSVYSDAAKSQLLDTHQQIIQSRFDLSDARNQRDFDKATVGGGNCPGSRRPETPDYSTMTASQLDAECERAREALLKPEREALIRRCKQGGEKNDSECENYWADYGAARRQGGRMIPPKYSDISVCRAARAARQRD
jgi:hypothetical protein